MSATETRSEQEREPKPEGPEPHRLSDLTQKRIGLHLRAMYDTIVQQPVPDRFRDLIARMDDSSVQTLDEA
nr:NepR family anti-sigma factor [Methylobacterium sp. 10]